MLQGLESFPWLCDSKPPVPWLSLSNRFSAMYDNRLNPFGDDEDALSDTPRTPSSAGSFRNHRAKYLLTLCSPFLQPKTLFAVWSCRLLRVKSWLRRLQSLGPWAAKLLVLFHLHVWFSLLVFPYQGLFTLKFNVPVKKRLPWLKW